MTVVFKETTANYVILGSKRNNSETAFSNTSLQLQTMNFLSNCKAALCPQSPPVHSGWSLGSSQCILYEHPQQINWEKVTALYHSLTCLPCWCFRLEGRTGAMLWTQPSTGWLRRPETFADRFVVLSPSWINFMCSLANVVDELSS